MDGGLLSFYGTALKFGSFFNFTYLLRLTFLLQVPLKKYLNIWTENRDNTRIIQGYFKDISEVRHLLEVSVHRLTGGILVRIS